MRHRSAARAALLVFYCLSPVYRKLNSMSSLISFIKSLNPRIQKPVVLKDIDAVIKELRDVAIPMTNDLSVSYKAAPFKSKWFDVFENNVRAEIKFARKSDNFWTDLNSALQIMLVNAQHLRKYTEDYLQEDTLRDGITAKATNIVRMVSAMSFASGFVIDAADYTLVQEAVTLGQPDDTPPAQAEYLNRNIEKFAQVMADCCIEPKKFEKLFADIPDVYVSEKNSSTVAAMFSNKQLDPFPNMSTTNWVGSPIYSARLVWETWMADRYHASKDRKAMLELRLIHLQNLQANSPNPRLEHEIEGLQARIRKYDKKIREIEESL